MTDPKSTPKPQTVIVPIRMSRKLRAAFRALAAADNRTLAGWFRNLGLIEQARVRRERERMDNAAPGSTAP